jgi:hypothetical protein
MGNIMNLQPKIGSFVEYTIVLSDLWLDWQQGFSGIIDRKIGQSNLNRIMLFSKTAKEVIDTKLVYDNQHIYCQFQFIETYKEHELFSNYFQQYVNFLKQQTIIQHELSYEECINFWDKKKLYDKLQLELISHGEGKTRGKI